MARAKQFSPRRPAASLAGRGVSRRSACRVCGRVHFPGATTSTSLLDEDNYPVGGFTSISTRSVESLLHRNSPTRNDDRPDLFDVKFLATNCCTIHAMRINFARRRNFVFALYADLEEPAARMPTRVATRIVLAIGLTLAAQARSKNGSARMR